MRKTQRKEIHVYLLLRHAPYPSTSTDFARTYLDAKQDVNYYAYEYQMKVFNLCQLKWEEHQTSLLSCNTILEPQNIPYTINKIFKLFKMQSFIYL